MPKHKKSKHEAGGKKSRKKLRNGRVEAVERIGGQFQLIRYLGQGLSWRELAARQKIKIGEGDGQTRS